MKKEHLRKLEKIFVLLMFPITILSAEAGIYLARMEIGEEVFMPVLFFAIYGINILTQIVIMLILGNVTHKPQT